MTDFVTVTQTPDGLVTATLWLDGLFLLGLSSRATNVQAVFKPVEGGSLCTATGTMGPANKACPSGMGLFSLQCYSISCTGAFSGISVGSDGSFETVVTADYSICQPAQPNCGMRSAESRTVKLQIPVVPSDSPIPTLIPSTQATTSTAASTTTSAQSSAVSAATAVTTSSMPVALTRSTSSQSTTTLAPTTTPSNTQSESSSNSTGNSIAVGVGIAFGIAVLAGIAFAIVRGRNGRRNKRLARLSAFSLTYPATASAAASTPRVPAKDVAAPGAWTAPGKPVVVPHTALDREAAENLARDVNAADAASMQQPGVMTQVYAAGHAQNQQQQVFPQYVTPQQQVQGTYVYPPASTASSQYPGYYDANGQYHFFNNQGQAPSHT
ncbi:hypothetical protein HDU78_007450 [Chytriomyces hyalinus]|nr:hypothetical protein HDU78_007450 [Chytriomyces hyalinus]